MNKYAVVALTAINLMKNNESTNVIDAWETAATVVFPNSETAQKKSCPKNAFLGLCEEGMVRGVESGNKFSAGNGGVK